MGSYPSMPNAQLHPIVSPLESNLVLVFSPTKFSRQVLLVFSNERGSDFEISVTERKEDVKSTGVLS